MNNDIYAEWLVKRKKPAYAPLVYIGIVLLFIVGVFASLMSPFGFLILLAAVGVAYFGTMRLNVEYEYVFVTNELSIDRIFSQRARKRIYNLEMVKVDKIVPTKSHEFDFARNNPKVKIINCSSGRADAVTYGVVYSGNEGQVVYIIEPNDKLLKCLKNSAPRKVIIEQAITASKE